MQLKGFTNNFEAALAREYEALLSELPLLGDLGSAPLKFQKIKTGYYASVMRQVDLGRFINFVFFADNIAGFEKDGLNSINENGEEIAEWVEKHIEFSFRTAKEQDDFRAGITLIVSCGWGRSIRHRIIEKKLDSWRIDSISAHDLFTLSWLNNFKSLSLWRIFDARDALKRGNVAALLAGEELDEEHLQRILARIIPNSDARHMHRFPIAWFRVVFTNMIAPVSPVEKL